MGLAPYGIPPIRRRVAWSDVIRILEDGSVQSRSALVRITGPADGWGRGGSIQLLDGPPRDTSAPLSQREADIACSAQIILERGRAWRSRATHIDRPASQPLCTAGGVALNCAANRRLREDGPFDSTSGCSRPPATRVAPSVQRCGRGTRSSGTIATRPTATR
jgi:carbamoyltransferase